MAFSISIHITFSVFVFNKFLLFLSIPFFVNIFLQSGMDKLDGMVDDTSMS